MTQVENNALGYNPAPTGQSVNPAAMVNDSKTYDGETKGATVIPSNVSGSSQPSSAKSPKLNVPAHRRNR